MKRYILPCPFSPSDPPFIIYMKENVEIMSHHLMKTSTHPTTILTAKSEILVMLLYL